MKYLFGLLIWGSLVWAGCRPLDPKESTEAQGSEHHDEHGHDHALAPHGGEIIELGGEYHIEIVKGSSGKLTFYLLDESGMKPLPIAASEIVMHSARDQQTKSFQIASSRLTTDPEGKSSRFRIQSKELQSLMEDPETKMRLKITIQGRQYLGVIRE